MQLYARSCAEFWGFSAASESSMRHKCGMSIKASHVTTYPHCPQDYPQNGCSKALYRLQMPCNCKFAVNHGLVIHRGMTKFSPLLLHRNRDSSLEKAVTIRLRICIFSSIWSKKGHRLWRWPKLFQDYLLRMVASVSLSKKCRREVSSTTVVSSPVRVWVRGSTRAMTFSSLPEVEKYR